MDSGLTFWNSGVWIIPLVLIATIVGLFFWARHLRKRVRELLKEMRSEIRRLSTRRKVVVAQVADHSVDDDEPYRTPMATLEEQVTRLDGLLSENEKRLVELQEELHRLDTSRGMFIVAVPFYFYSLYQRCLAGRKALKALEPVQVAAEEESQRVAHVAWEVAQSARRACDDRLRLKRALQNLVERNVGGNSLEAALRQEESLQQVLADIPSLFIQGDEESVLRTAQKEAVVQVFAIVQKARPLLDNLLSQVKEWEEGVRAAIEQVSQARKQLTSTETALVDIPNGLNLETQLRAMEGLQIIAQNLQATLGRLEVESLGIVVAEAKRVAAAAQELEVQVRQGRQNLADLEKALPELAQELRQLSLQFTALGTSKVRPLAWGKSRALLTSLSRQVNALELPVRRPRSPEQIVQELENISRLRVQLRELANHCQAIAGQHALLLHLLEDPEVMDWRNWVDNTRALLEKIAPYAQENWQRADQVGLLASDLEAIASSLEQMVSSERSKPVDEAELDNVLALTRQLVDTYRAMRVRVDNIRARWVEIQATEKAALEKTGDTLALFQQILHLVRSNTYLTEVAAVEGNRIYAELQGADADLRSPERGLVERKSRHAETVIAKAEEAVNGWLGKLLASLVKQLNELSAVIASLDAIASLDEPAISEARRLLSSAPTYTSGSGGVPRAKFSLARGTTPENETSLLELKRRCDFWQHILACRNALEELARQVVENYKLADENRRIARQEYQSITDWIRDSHGWPPMTVSLQSERQEMARLEESWEALKTQKMRGMQLAAQLGNLAARYQALGERLEQASARATEDQSQITDLESEYAELVQLWQSQLRQYPSDSLTSKEIRELLATAERELLSIRQSYRQGNRDYTQVLHALRTMVRKVRIALVSVDDRHQLDILGNVKAMR